MAEGYFRSEGNSLKHTPTAAVAAGEVLQLPDGRAGVAATAIAAGVQGAVQVCGIVEVAKTDSMVMLQGSRVYWDHSGSAASLLFGATTRDFYLGVVQEDAASSATTVKVALNVEPAYALSLADGFASVPVSTAGWPHVVGSGKNGVSMIFDATAEAQKLDALTLRGIATGTPCIVNARVCVNVAGDHAALDFNVGLADGTNASDADSITASLFAHIDGASANILIESDDDTTEVAAADSTVDFAAGTPFLVQFDVRDWTDPQVYINGVNVLPSSVFDISAATGPMKLLAHMEKSSNDTPGNITVMELGAVTFDV